MVSWTVGCERPAGQPGQLGLGVVGSQRSEGSQGLSMRRGPGPAAPSARTTPGSPAVTGAWSLDAGASGSPVPSLSPGVETLPVS